MTVRHESLTFVRGTALRRKFNDGKLPELVYWGGREYGWTTFDTCKLYSTKTSARNALKLILRHERELGLHGRADRRY